MLTAAGPVEGVARWLATPGGELPAGAASSPVTEALGLLARDTIRGFVVWVVPGDDPYSRAQGQVSPTPGAIDARADEFLLEGLDGLLPFPDDLLRPVLQALRTGSTELPVPALPTVPDPLAEALDDGLATVLANDEAVPLALVVATLLNLLAVSVEPASVAGPFPAAPFANLSHEAKTEAFRRLEEDAAGTAAIADADLSEPAKRSVSGLLRLLGSALPTFTAFASYSEFHAFDRTTGTVSRRPIGWDLSNFSPGNQVPVDGWDEFKGYHRGLM